TIIGKNVKIGPFCIIDCTDGPVKLGDNVSLGFRVLISGPCEIGGDTVITGAADIGHLGMDFKHQSKDGMTGVKIGERNIIRENATIHQGMPASPAGTVIGNDCMIMVNTHITHDCNLGSHIRIANAAHLAGHVIVEDYAIISGMLGIQQFCRIGKYSMTGMQSKITTDILPYSINDGVPSIYRGLNRIGLNRHGFSRESQRSIRIVYDAYFGKKDDDFSARSERLAAIKDKIQDPYALDALDFVENRSKCGPLSIFRQRGK
ncbi:MAG: acyl-ACP--UDP-N-acetylglucosamine O-acyltransferase, partial [Rickettsiales bacterium]|nr:acyl-ACP--UDP-N-acetylglucosamine O-acyltransferase [Rickettsiales bacterium]